MIGNIVAGLLRVATLPIAVVADAITLGGVLTDKDESYTMEAFSKIGENVSNTLDELEEK